MIDAMYCSRFDEVIKKDDDIPEKCDEPEPSE
jgi:hypothetical protein